MSAESTALGLQIENSELEVQTQESSDYAGASEMDGTAQGKGIKWRVQRVLVRAPKNSNN